MEQKLVVAMPTFARRYDEAGKQYKPVVADKQVRRSTTHLHAGHIFVSADPCFVSTILGSCVAVCIWDLRLKVGGMNHYLLPYMVESDQSSARFGNVAISRLIEKLVTLGGHRRNLRAKIFGGAHIIDALRGGENSLGARNIQVAIDLLAAEQIPVIAQDLGGRRARNLVFNTGDGTALVKRL